MLSLLIPISITKLEVAPKFCIQCQGVAGVAEYRHNWLGKHRKEGKKQRAGVAAVFFAKGGGEGCWLATATLKKPHFRGSRRVSPVLLVRNGYPPSL